jgi:hypothetical protein
VSSVRDGHGVIAHVGDGAAPGHVDVAVCLDAETEEGDRRKQVVVELLGRAGVEAPVREIAVDLVAEKAFDIGAGGDARVGSIGRRRSCERQEYGSRKHG